MCDCSTMVGEHIHQHQKLPNPLVNGQFIIFFIIFMYVLKYVQMFNWVINLICPQCIYIYIYLCVCF